MQQATSLRINTIPWHLSGILIYSNPCYWKKQKQTKSKTKMGKEEEHVKMVEGNQEHKRDWPQTTTVCAHVCTHKCAHLHPISTHKDQWLFPLQSILKVPFWKTCTLLNFTAFLRKIMCLYIYNFIYWRSPKFQCDKIQKNKNDIYWIGLFNVSQPTSCKSNCIHFRGKHVYLWSISPDDLKTSRKL